MEKTENWLSINLPANCPNICISFKREVAENQIKKFGSIPLYGFDKKEEWLPAEVFITYGGSLAPGRNDQEIPWESKCFTKDFAHMFQLFRILTEQLNFSQSFRMEIDYDPKQLRTSVKTYMPKEVLESHIQKIQEIGKD